MRLFLLVLSLVVSAGCGDSINQKTYPVTGEVRLDGKPFKGLTVVLRPVDKTNFKRQEIPQGITDENGKYTIYTYVSNDGAPAGDYKVGIALMQPVDEECLQPHEADLCLNFWAAGHADAAAAQCSAGPASPGPADQMMGRPPRRPPWGRGPGVRGGG